MNRGPGAPTSSPARKQWASAARRVGDRRSDCSIHRTPQPKGLAHSTWKRHLQLTADDTDNTDARECRTLLDVFALTKRVNTRSEGGSFLSVSSARSVVSTAFSGSNAETRRSRRRRNAGILAQIKGFVIGQFTGCKPGDPAKPHLKLAEIFDQDLSWVTAAAVEGFQYGHVARKLTLPFGLGARLDADRGILTVPESAVE